MAAILPMALLAHISDASAQRKNTTEKDIPAAVQQVQNDAAAHKMHDQKMMKKHDKMAKYDKKMMKQGEWLNKKTAEINEDYNEAIEKINKSSFSDANKNILKTQAQENRDLALKQVKERADLKAKHWEARKAMRNEMMAEKANHKAVKEVEDID